MGILDSVQSMVDPGCLVSKIRKEGCTLSLRDSPQKRLIVDFDRPEAPIRNGGPRCDYLFVAEDTPGKTAWIAPLELKRGSVRTSEAVRQLRAGAEIAEALIPGDLRSLFRPAVVYGSIHKRERDALKDRRNRITFHGRSEAVRLASCGDRLTSILRP